MLLYLLYVVHYAVDIPIFDDWSLTVLTSHALHHHLTLGELWSQHGDTRLFVVRPVWAVFGWLDHLNYKHITLFSAATYIASFAMLLSLFRVYLGRRLTFLPVLLLGVVWFTVADVENSLWSFQLGWYLVVFFFVAMTHLLLLRHHRPNVFFALGVGAAVLAALTEVQGFVVWPVGLICLLWASPWGRRTIYESAIWCSTAVLTTAIYLHGYNYAGGHTACVLERGTKESCSLAYGLEHPVAFGKFMAVLVGNVVPTPPGTWIGVHELVGLAIVVVAGFVIVRSVRERSRGTIPLPLVLIVFALLFDLMIALSRVGQGAVGAGRNWYTMPNVILLTGIVVYACAHLPDARAVRERSGNRELLKVVGSVVLVAFVVVQCFVATRFGITHGAKRKAYLVDVAHIIVNTEKIPADRRDCYVTYAAGVFGFLKLPELSPYLEIAEADRLTFFRRSTLARYRNEGPPRYAPCDGQ